MVDRASLPYRPCVGIMVLNRDGLVFFGRRVSRDNPEHVPGSRLEWQMPQGGIDPGEMPLDAARRELWEETSIRSVSLLAEAPEWLSYDLPDIARSKAWSGRYRGQTQRWFAFRFEGDESEIDIVAPGGGRHKPEFQAWRWERMADLPRHVIEFKRPVYEKVVSFFAPFAGA